jgi:hypothetical protein
MDAWCWVNLEAGEVFGILILAKLGITSMLLGRHLWLKYVPALQLYIQQLVTDNL